jgi:large subunit ribosomal protein L15
MKYHELQVKAHRDTKRRGRGIGSGKGKTAGRGTKGAGARQGYKKRPGFEGGQTPIMQHLPKLPGFTNMHPKAENVFTGQLERFAGKIVDAQLLFDNSLVSSPYVTIKLLSGKGDLTKKVTVKVQASSASALVAVQQAGGSFEAVPRAQRAASKEKKA